MALQPIAAGVDVSAPPVHYVDWAPILAGTVIATAVAIIMFTFGTAIGLSMVSPYEGEGVSKSAYLAALGLWTMWVIASSFMAGGYVAGRMRRRTGDGTEHEVEVRDGAHGLTVWALGIVVASWLLTMGVTGLLGAATKAGAAAGGAAAATATDNDRTAFTIDSLFRAPARGGQVAASNTTPTAGAPTAATAEAMAGNTETAAAPAMAMRGNANADRGEARRLLMYGMVKGELTADNKTALARIVANRTGMSQSEAEARVTQVVAEVKKAADTARKTGIVLGFLTAAALLIGGAAAAWSATLGGRHRDQNTDTAAFWRWS